MAGLEGTSFDQYHLISLLGQGGMSEVYLAQDVETGDRVAVKVVSGSNAVYLERFRREAEVIDKLRHPHILPALDYGDLEPWHYLVMPLVEGGTLRERLQGIPLQLPEASKLLDQVADALQFAHNHGIIHRDIKPSNILMRDEHYLYLADFGLVKNLEGGEQLTLSGTLLGTPEYMSPDLADGPATASSDIYALGVLLYQMVTGFVPFTGETAIAVYWKHLRDNAVPPSLLNAELSTEIDRVLMRALEKDRTKRYQSTRELAEDFKQAVYAEEIAIQERNKVEVELVRTEQGADGGEIQHYPPERESTQPSSWRAGQREHLARRSGDPDQTPLILEADNRGEWTPQLTTSLPQLLIHRLRQNRQRTSGSITPVPVEVMRDRRLRSAQSQRLTWLTSAVIVVGLLLFIILPMSYVYYIYSTQHTVVLAQATATVQAQVKQQEQATATANILIDAVSGEPILDDPLIINTGNRWSEDGTNCSFVGTSYQVVANKNNILQICHMLAPQISDVTVQVDVSLVDSGNAGLLLRVSGSHYYDFELTNQGQFFFRRNTLGQSNETVNLLPPQTNGVILQGLQHNTLVVIARGSDFKLFINGAFVGEVHDTSYEDGGIALVAGAQSAFSSGTAHFNNFKLYGLH
jgi:serine/threonine protein kinase